MKKRNIIIFAIYFCFIIIILILGTIFISKEKWIIENLKTEQQINNIISHTSINKSPDNSNTIYIKQKLKVKNPIYIFIKNFIPKALKNKKIKKIISNENPYYSIYKDDFINVDIKSLKKSNNDSIGWLQVNNTSINFPFVQSNDNKYYLNHSYDNSKNNIGWLFLDYRNNDDLSDKNNIIYIFSKPYKAMFNNINDISYGIWLNNSKNFSIKISTEKENTFWQIFSIYFLPLKNDFNYNQLKFNDNQFSDFANNIINRSRYQFNTYINNNDTILTLQSVYNNNELFIIHAKLIKKQKK